MFKQYIFLSLALFIGSIPLFSQLNWAPLGAQWHYSSFEGCEEGCSEGYLTVEVIGDSIAGDLTLRKLEIIRHYSVGSEYRIGYMFTYSMDSVIYYWVNDTSYVMYDFSKEVGETHLVYGKGENYLTDGHCGAGSIGSVQIDSIGMEKINGIDANYYYATRVDTSYWEYSRKISSIYGSQYFLFATEIFCDVADVGDFAGPLRCYEDSRIGLVTFYDYPCDTLMPTTVHVNEEYRRIVKIFPNPVHGQLQIEVPFETPSSLGLAIQFISINGTIVSSHSLKSQYAVVDISHLAKGVYFARCFSPYIGTISIKKIIVPD